MNILERRSGSIAAALFFMALCSHAAPGLCPDGPSAYNGYKILKVDVRDPIGFIALFNSESALLKSGLLLKPDEPFSFDKFNQDNTVLNAILKANFAASQQKVKLSYAAGQILDCDPAARTLRVQYTVFTSVLPTSTAPSIEEKAKETDRPATTGATRGSEPGLLVNPLVGYDQARGLLGGLNFSDPAGKFHPRGEFEGSANSYTGYLELSGNIGPFAKIWNRADWAGMLDYQDAPAGVTRFEEGKVIGRFSASSKESAKQHVIVRYGAALEGGHAQSNKPDTATLAPNSEYGSLKLYAGTTGTPGNSAFTASYGFQLGSTFRSRVPDFKKHLVDLGFNTTLRGESGKDTGAFKGPLSTTVHKALTIETRFTAGLIQGGSSAPLAERFLGGNAVRLFIPDDSWVIQSDAFIRSIPENQLGALSRDAALGGSRFYSANITLAWPLWGRPMLPKELAEQPTDPKEVTFLDALNGQFDGAVKALANSYKSKDPDYATKSAGITAEAGNLGASLNALSEKLKEISPAIAAQPSVAKALSAIKLNLIEARQAAALIAAGPKPQVTTSLVGNLLPTLSTLIQGLTNNLNDTSQAALVSQVQSLTAEIERSGEQIAQMAAKLPSQIYLDRAQQTLAPGHRAIDVFLHELNIYSIAPVAIVDVARVWPVDEPVHYGVGPGLRLSLVNVNLTFAYAVNSNHVRPESAGAVFFKLDVTNLF